MQSFWVTRRQLKEVGVGRWWIVNPMITSLFTTLIMAALVFLVSLDFLSSLLKNYQFNIYVFFGLKLLIIPTLRYRNAQPAVPLCG